jgi:hypothetical protein
MDNAATSHALTYGLIGGAAFMAGLFIGMAGKLLAIGPWLRVVFSGGDVRLMHIIGMRLRGSPLDLIIDAYLSLVHSDVSVPIAHVESLYIANKSRVFSAQDLVGIVKEHFAGQRGS